MVEVYDLNKWKEIKEWLTSYNNYSEEEATKAAKEMDYQYLKLFEAENSIETLEKGEESNGTEQ